MKKKTIVVHSGGMDSSLCLAMALAELGRENVLSLSFNYAQRHSIELQRSQLICDQWKIDHTVLDIQCLNQITENSLTRHDMDIQASSSSLGSPFGQAPNSLVMGRNGLMARIAAIQANSLGARRIEMGVMELESANSGYRDCSRDYMNKMEEILRIDLNDPEFEIRTPLARMTKLDTMELGHRLGVLQFLLETTVTCYQGIEKQGCLKCPSCKLRNDGIRAFVQKHPDFEFSYRSFYLTEMGASSTFNANLVKPA